MPQAGLKTGMYYLRTRAAADAIKFTVDQQAVAKNRAARQSSSAPPQPGAAAVAMASPVLEAPIGFTPTPEVKVWVQHQECELDTASGYAKRVEGDSHQYLQWLWFCSSSSGFWGADVRKSCAATPS